MKPKAKTHRNRPGRRAAAAALLAAPLLVTSCTTVSDLTQASEETVSSPEFQDALALVVLAHEIGELKRARPRPRDRSQPRIVRVGPPPPWEPRIVRARRCPRSPVAR